MPKHIPTVTSHCRMWFRILNKLETLKSAASGFRFSNASWKGKKKKRIIRVLREAVSSRTWTSQLFRRGHDYDVTGNAAAYELQVLGRQCEQDTRGISGSAYSGVPFLGKSQQFCPWTLYINSLNWLVHSFIYPAVCRKRIQVCPKASSPQSAT
jgi:hypothetical protein